MAVWSFLIILLLVILIEALVSYIYYTLGNIDFEKNGCNANIIKTVYDNRQYALYVIIAAGLALGVLLGIAIYSIAHSSRSKYRYY